MMHALERGTIAKNETGDGLEVAYNSVCKTEKLTNEN